MHTVASRPPESLRQEAGDHVVRISGLTKRFSDHLAVAHLDLEVARGTIYGVLGPNGAGKSTTIRMLLGIIARDAGTVDILGKDPENDRDVLRRIGYLPEERGLYRKMKVLDTIVFFSGLKGVDRRTARTEGNSWLERLGIAEWRDARVETLSKGMQQKVQFICTVLHRPELLILDEPFSGLDPVNQEVLRNTVLEAREEGRTVLFSTHVMEQAESICDRVCIIADGRRILEGGVREIRRDAATNRFELDFEEASPGVTRFVEESLWFTEVRSRAQGGWEVSLAETAPRDEVLREMASLDSPLRRFVRIEPSLSQIFVSHVGARAGTAHRRGGDSNA